MKDKYDVIIIGAGVGGLVCGCYLSKAGMKVLIVEQHYQPGGYCTSFKRGGYTFDVGVHYLGGGRHNGEIGKIMKDFNLAPKLKFVCIDPCDKIIMPDRVIYIRKNPVETIEEFKSNFPNEAANIKSFFDFIQQKNIYNLYAKTCLKTFKEVLDNFFVNDKLKATLSVLLGNAGLSASRVSALTAIFLYREFILDGGYYPEGGMQSFSNSLANKVLEFGGKIEFSKKVKTITTKNGKVTGAVLDNNEKIESNFVVSNVDATQTFKDLLDVKIDKVIKKIDGLEVATSAFILFLGLNLDLKNVLKEHCTHWLFSSYDTESIYNNTERHMNKNPLDYTIATFPSLHDPNLSPEGGSSVSVLIGAPFKSKKFWDYHKETLADKMIAKLGSIVPNINSHINTRVIGTPYTFCKYTLNKFGAMYGWASTPKQVRKTTFPQETCVGGLYSAGHWCTNGLGQGGVSVAAYSGRNASRLILKERSRYTSETFLHMMEN